MSLAYTHYDPLVLFIPFQPIYDQIIVQMRIYGQKKCMLVDMDERCASEGSLAPILAIFLA